MTSFFSELQRRNVFRVTAAYAIVGWLIAQIADLGLESFGAPDWVMKTLLLLLIIGLPVAIVLSWAFEMTSEGVRRETDAADALPVVPKSGRKLDLIIIACLAIALAYFVYESREDAGAGSRIVVDKSIAVLPFINIGGNTEDDYLSDGLAETLLHLLAQVEEIQVAARTSAFKFKNTNEDVRIIGEQLGVATVLEGSIQRSGEKIRITAQLINVDDGFHLWSANFDRTINDIFVVQDEIAKSVVAALQVTLLGDVQYSEGLDPAAYDRLLRLR
jgi:TolB-like protein